MTQLAIALWGALLLILPGWAAWRLLGSFDVPLLVQPALALGLTMSMLALICWTCHLLGLGFAGVRVMTLAGIAWGLLTLAASVRWRVHTTEPAPRLARGYLVAVLAIVLAAGMSAMLSGTWVSLTADTFYHLASVRSVVDHGNALPKEVFFSAPVPAPDPTSGTWNVALGLLVAFSGADPLTVYRFATVAVALAVPAAFFWLALCITRNAAASTIATALYVGIGLNFDFRTTANPAHVGMLLAWIALGAAIRYVDAGSRRMLLAAALVAFGASAMHGAVSPFLIVSLGAALIAAIFVPRPNQRRVVLACVVVGAAAVPFMLVNLATLNAPAPYAAMAQAALPLRVIHHPWPWVWPRFWFFNAGAIFGTAFVVLLLRPWRDGQLGAGITAVGASAAPLAGLVPIFAVSYFAQYTLARVSDSLQVFAWIAWGWGLVLLLTAIAARRLRLPAAALVAASLIGILAGVYVGPYKLVSSPALVRSFASSRSTDLTVTWHDQIAAIRQLPAGSVLLAHPDDAYELSGLTGREVVAVPASHMPAQIEVRDGPRRRADALDAMLGRLDPPQFAGVLEHYRVTHVFANRASIGDRGWSRLEAAQILVPIASGTDWRLYRYDSTQLGAYLQEATPGITPGFALAGRAIFARIEWPAATPVTSVSLVATAEGGGPTYRRKFSAEPGAETVALPLPFDAVVDRYQVRLEGDGVPPDAIGEASVARLYQVEDFGGVVAGAANGWTVTPGDDYEGGLAASTADMGSVAQQTVPAVGPGSYCVGAVVYDYGTGATNVIRVGGDGQTAALTWSGANAGLRTVSGLVMFAHPTSHLTVIAVARGQPEFVVDALELYPAPAAGC